MEPAGGVLVLRLGVDLREVRKAERREAAPVGRKEETEPTVLRAGMTEAGEALAVAVVEGVADWGGVARAAAACPTCDCCCGDDIWEAAGEVWDCDCCCCLSCPRSRAISSS